MSLIPARASQALAECCLPPAYVHTTAKLLSRDLLQIDDLADACLCTADRTDRESNEQRPI